MKNDRPPACKYKIWWMENKESSLPGLNNSQLQSSCDTQYQSTCTTVCVDGYTGVGGSYTCVVTDEDTNSVGWSGSTSCQRGKPECMHPCVHACVHVCVYVCVYVCMSIITGSEQRDLLVSKRCWAIHMH